MKKNCSIIMLLSILLVVTAAGCQTASQKPIERDQNLNVTPNQVDSDFMLTDSEARAIANRLAIIAEQVEGVDRASVIVADLAPDVNDTTGGRRYSVNNTGGNNNRYNYTSSPTRINNGASGNNVVDLNLNNDNTITRTRGDTNGNNDNADNNGIVAIVGITLDKSMMNDNQVKSIKQKVVNKLKACDNRISNVMVTTDPNLILRINNVASGIVQGKPIANFRDDINDLAQTMGVSRPTL